MSQGLQYQRTDKAIVDAFLDLVIEKSFDKVTVQNILERAMISKNTFYSHYRDKYDIAEQLFEEYKKSFHQFLWENYGKPGKELAGKDDFQHNMVNQAAQAAYSEYTRKNGRIIAALGRIQTEKVNMQNFVRELFKERYLNAPSNEGRSSTELELESDIYAGVFSAISLYYMNFSSTSPDDTSSHYPTGVSGTFVDLCLCNAFLYSIGIIEKSCSAEARTTLTQIQEKAHNMSENYQP